MTRISHGEVISSCVEQGWEGPCLCRLGPTNNKVQVIVLQGVNHSLDVSLSLPQVIEKEKGLQFV